MVQRGKRGAGLPLGIDPARATRRPVRTCR